ncbi:MAG: PAS domain S-box protein [Nitrospiraceae bacterium]|nr:PAS domain S-box protein [Nitrospiraceae bacterium]
MPARVIAVIPPDSPPTYFRDQNGKAAGFAVDVMNAVAARAGLDVEYLFEDGWDDIIELLKSGKADVSPGMGVGRDREKDLVFSALIDAFPISFFVRAEHAGIETTPGVHTVGVIRGSVAFEKLHSRSSLHLVSYEGFAQGLFDLLAGKIESFACPAPTLWQLARESGVEDRIKVVDKPIAEIQRAIAARKDHRALIDRLNVSINEYVGTPAYQKVYAKWYGTQAVYWTPQRIVGAGSALLLVMVGLMAGWRYLSVLRLNRELTRAMALLRESEEALRRSTAELNAFFDVAVDLLCIADTDGRFHRLNPAWERTLGFSLDELMAGKILDFVHPDDRAATLDAIATLAAQRQVINFVNRYRHRDGTYRWIEWRSAPSGTLIYAAARDITERRQIETALRENEAVLRSFLNAVTESAFLIDRNGRILAANETVARRLGSAHSEIIGRPVYDLLPPGVAARRRDHYDRVFSTGQPHRFEDERLGRIIDNSVYPVFDTGGAVIALAIIGIDITERKRADLALEASEKKYRMLYDSAIDAIFILDLQGKFIDANRTAHERLGYTREEFLAMHLSQLDPPNFAAKVGERISQLKGQGRLIFESANLSKDGTIMPVEINARIIDYDGEKALFSIVRDITERKLAEREREKLIAELQKALAEIKTLHGVLPICASCKKIRDDQGAWHQLEVYIRDHTDAEFSHGLCMDCAKKLYPQVIKENENPAGR